VTLSARILEVRNLKKYFPVKTNLFGKGTEFVKAVDGIDFHINYGEVLGLVGESGSGKSTTGRTIIRLLDPTEGEIIFEGKDITHLKKDRLRSVYKHMQLVFQDPFASLNPRKKVGNAIDEVLYVHGMKDKAQRREAVRELFDMVGLRGEEDKYPHEFSGGQRQRVVIARALAVEPKLIICDEPVSALDVSIQAQVINLLTSLKNRLGLSYLFISHDLRVVKYMSDRVAVMYLGRIAEIAPAEELFRNPAHPYSMALLSVATASGASGQNKEKIILEGEVPSPVDPPSGCRFRTRCRYATKQCSEIEPQVKCIGGEHYVRCHLY